MFSLWHQHQSSSSTSYYSSSSSSDSFLRSKAGSSSFSPSASFFSGAYSKGSSSSSQSGRTSNRRMAAMPVMFFNFSPEGCSEEKMTTWPLQFFTSSYNLLMFLRLSKSLLRKRQSLINSFWTAFILIHRVTYFSPYATLFSFIFITSQNSQSVLDWLMALVFSIFCMTVGSDKTSLRLFKQPLEHLASTILSNHLLFPLSFSFSSSVLMNLSSWSLRNPGLAMTKHLMRQKLSVEMMLQHSWKNLLSDLRQISSPAFFFDMFRSIFFFRRVIDCFTQQRCATPSSITIAAISTPCSSLAIYLIRLISYSGHSSLQMVILVYSSISNVWNCPIFRNSFYLELRPLMLMHSRSSLAKQLISTIWRVRVRMRLRIFLRPETLVSSMILRLVFMRMWSPFWMRLQMCQRSSSSVGTQVTQPSPHTFLMFLRSIRMQSKNIIQELIIKPNYNSQQEDQQCLQLKILPWGVQLLGSPAPSFLHTSLRPPTISLGCAFGKTAFDAAFNQQQGRAKHPQTCSQAREMICLYFLDHCY